MVTRNRPLDPKISEQLSALFGGQNYGPGDVRRPRTEPPPDISVLDEMVDAFGSGTEIDKFLEEFIPAFKEQAGRLPQFGEVFTSQQMIDLGFDTPLNDISYEFERRADKESGFGILQVLPTGERISDRGFVWPTDGSPPLTIDQWLDDDKPPQSTLAAREYYKLTDPFYREYAEKQGWDLMGIDDSVYWELAEATEEDRTNAVDIPPSSPAPFGSGFVMVPWFVSKDQEQAWVDLPQKVRQNIYAQAVMLTAQQQAAAFRVRQEQFAVDYHRVATEQAFQEGVFDEIINVQRGILSMFPDATSSDIQYPDAFLTKKINENTEEFLSLIQERGNTPETVAVLRMLGMSDEEMSKIIPVVPYALPGQYPSEGEIFTKLGKDIFKSGRERLKELPDGDWWYEDGKLHLREGVKWEGIEEYPQYIEPDLRELIDEIGMHESYPNSKAEYKSELLVALGKALEDINDPALWRIFDEMDYTPSMSSILVEYFNLTDPFSHVMLTGGSDHQRDLLKDVLKDIKSRRVDLKSDIEGFGTKKSQKGKEEQETNKAEYKELGEMLELVGAALDEKSWLERQVDPLMEDFAKGISYVGGLINPFIDKTAEGIAYRGEIAEQYDNLPLWLQLVGDAPVLLFAPSGVAAKAYFTTLRATTQRVLVREVAGAAETALTPLAAAEAVPGIVAGAALNKAFSKFVADRAKRTVIKAGIERDIAWKETPFYRNLKPEFKGTAFEKDMRAVWDLVEEGLDDQAEAVMKSITRDAAAGRYGELVKRQAASGFGKDVEPVAPKILDEVVPKPKPKVAKPTVEPPTLASFPKRYLKVEPTGIPTKALTEGATKTALKEIGLTDATISKLSVEEANEILIQAGKMTPEEAQGILAKPQGKQPWEMTREEYKGYFTENKDTIKAKKGFVEGDTYVNAPGEKIKIGDGIEMSFAGRPSNMPRPWKLVDAENYYSTVDYGNHVRLTVEAKNGERMVFDNAEVYSPHPIEFEAPTLPKAPKLQEARNAAELEKRLVEPVEPAEVTQPETARLRTEHQDRITEIDNILATPGKVPSEYGTRAEYHLLLEQEVGWNRARITQANIIENSDNLDDIIQIVRDEIQKAEYELERRPSAVAKAIEARIKKKGGSAVSPKIGNQYPDMSTKSLEEYRGEMADFLKQIEVQPKPKEPPKPVTEGRVSMGDWDDPIVKLKEEFEERLANILLKQLSKDMEIKEKTALIQEMKDTLVQYTKRNLPPQLRHRLLTKIARVKTERQLEKAMDLVDKYAQRPKVIEEAKTMASEAKTLAGADQSPFTELPSAPKTEVAANKAIENFNKKVVPESPLDVGSVGYLETGNINSYVDAMPEHAALKWEALHKEIQRASAEIDALIESATHKVDRDKLTRIKTNMQGGKELTLHDIAQLGIASMQKPDGKLAAAIRKSGFYVTKKFAEYPNFEDVKYISGYFMDTSRMVQSIDGGFNGGALQRNVLWPTHSAYKASQTYQDTNKHIFQDLMKKYKMVGSSQNAKLRKTIFHLLQNPENEKVILKGFTDEERARARAFTKEVRKLYDERLNDQNLVRAKDGREPIGKIENYAQWTADRGLWAKLMGKNVAPDEMFKETIMPDFIKPNATFNPRAQARTHGLEPYLKEDDIKSLYCDYVGTASKDIFYTGIIQNAKVHAAWLKASGYDSSSALVQDWIAEVYAGKTPAITAAAEKIIPKSVLMAGYMMRRNLTRSVFPLNFKWNTLIQTSSSALTIMRTGIRNTVMGLEWFTNSKVREGIRANAYSHIIKSKRSGSVVYQDIGTQVEKNLALEGRLIDKVEHYANFLTNVVENNLTGLSIEAAYKDGLKRGYEEGSRELWEFASEGGAKTQSMYNFQDQAGVLRNKVVGVVVPFQSFAFEVFNTSRELGLIYIPIPHVKEGKPGIHLVKPRAGAWQSIGANTVDGKTLISKRLKMLAEWVAAMMVINAVADHYINRRPWQPSSFIPFYALVTHGFNAGSPWGGPLPYQYMDEFKKGVDDVVKYEDFKELRQWFIRYHMIAGTQINRTLEGTELVIQGEDRDARGNLRYEIDTGDWTEVFKAISMGPYATQASEDYYKDRYKGEGVIEEWFGIPVPDRKSIGGTVKDAHRSLGTVDDYGNVYEASDLMGELGKLEASVGSKRWRESDNEFVQARKDYEDADSTYKGFGSKKPININTDPSEGDTLEDYIGQWVERSQIESETELKEFDKRNPDAELGNLSLRTIDLLRQYHELDEEDQREFLRDNPDINISPRDAWLKKNPKENAILAIWGKAHVLTREAFNIAQGLLEKYDIPDSAVEDYFPNKTIVDQGLFEYYKNAAMYAPNSAEAMLTLLDLQDEGKHELITFLDREMPEKPREFYEITVKHRAEDDEYEGYGQFNSPYYIADDEARAVARDEFLQGDEEYRVARIRRDALGAGLPEHLIPNHVEYSELPTQGYARERYLRDNQKYYKAWLTMGEGHAEVDFDAIPNPKYDELLFKFESEIVEYDTLDEDQRQPYLDRNTQFKSARYEMRAYKDLFPDGQVRNYVKWYTDYQKKPEGHEGTWYEDDWFLMENQGFHNAMVEQGVWKSHRDLSKVPTREVWDWFNNEYLKADVGADRLVERLNFPKGDKWLVDSGKVSKMASDPTYGKVLSPPLQPEDDVDITIKELEKQALEDIQLGGRKALMPLQPEDDVESLLTEADELDPAILEHLGITPEMKARDITPDQITQIRNAMERIRTNKGTPDEGWNPTEEEYREWERLDKIDDPIYEHNKRIQLKDWSRSMSTDLWEGMDIGYKRETITFEDGSSKEMDVIDPESVGHAEFAQMHHRVIKIGELEMRWEVERMEEYYSGLKPPEERIPGYVNQWLESWGVPESEWEKWRNYTVKIAKGENVDYAGAYSRRRRDIDINEQYTTLERAPGIIAHEFAHVNYFEELPEEMGGGTEHGYDTNTWYAKAHEYAQKISPAYKKALETYNDKGTAYLPVEGYATAYGTRQDEWDVGTKLPWFLEPFYGNLLFEVPDLPGDEEKAALVWIISYMKDRLGQDMTDEEAKLAFSQMAMYTPREAFEGFPKDIWE